MDLRYFKDAVIVEFIFRVYHKQVVVVRRLPSYEDANLLVRESGSDTSDRLFVLKIFRSFDNAKKTVIERQLKCVKRLRAKGFNCSQFLVGDDGYFTQRFLLGKVSLGQKNGLSDTSDSHWCVFYTFLPGYELENVTDVSHPTIAFELGAYLGLLHQALQDEPSDDLAPDPEDPWHMGNIQLFQQQEYLQVVESSAERQRLVQILKKIAKELDSSVHVLRKGVVHGDVHGLNLVVDKDFSTQTRGANLSFWCMGGEPSTTDVRDKEQNWDQNVQEFTLLQGLEAFKRNSCTFQPTELKQIYGLLDFGEMCYCSYVLEIGRLIADLMVTKMSKLQSQTMTNREKSDCEVNDAQPGISLETPIATYGDTAMKMTYKKRSNGQMHDEHLPKSAVQEDRDAKTRENVTSRGSDEWRAGGLCISPNILFIGGFVLAGYVTTNSLSAAEVDVVKAAVMSSLVQYFVLGKKSVIENPDNSDYSGQCAAEAEMLLWQLHDMDKSVLYNTWTEAVLSTMSLGQVAH